MHIKGYKVQSPVYFTTKKVTISIPTRIHVRKPLKVNEPATEVEETKAPKTVTPKARKNTPKRATAPKPATEATTA